MQSSRGCRNPGVWESRPCANVIAWLKGVRAVCGEWLQMGQNAGGFRALVAQIWYVVQNAVFGDAIEEAGQESKDNRTRDRKICWNCPDLFTTDAMRERQSVDMDVKGTRNMLYQWRTADMSYTRQMTVKKWKRGTS